VQAHNLLDAINGLGEVEFRQLTTFDRGNEGVYWAQTQTGVSPWERHPADDELLYVIEGRVVHNSRRSKSHIWTPSLDPVFHLVLRSVRRTHGSGLHRRGRECRRSGGQLPTATTRAIRAFERSRPLRGLSFPLRNAMTAQMPPLGFGPHGSAEAFPVPDQFTR
jgi:hypothetical protein